MAEAKATNDELLQAYQDLRSPSLVAQRFGMNVRTVSSISRAPPAVSVRATRQAFRSLWNISGIFCDATSSFPQVSRPLPPEGWRCIE